MQALLFAEHPDEAAVLTVLLQRAGFSVRTIRNLDQAIDAWPEQPSDMILITQPEDKQGTFRQVRQFRAHAAVPIIVIGDLLSDEEQVRFLEAGVDLVVTKPYSVRVFLAQIKALLRRSSSLPFFTLPVLTRDAIILDPSNRTVQVGDHQPKRLTHLEFRLLYTLMIHGGQIIPADDIIEHVWGYSGEGNRELVRGLVQRLRAKVEPDPRNPRFVLTEPGIGYYFQSR